MGSISIAIREVLLGSVLFPVQILALGKPKYVATKPDSDSFRLLHDGTGARICADAADYPGVVRAIRCLLAVVVRITGRTPPLSGDGKPLSGDVLLIGAIGKGPMIDRLVREHKIDVSQINGKWESTPIEV
jgi:hypothetical protein